MDTRSFNPANFLHAVRMNQLDIVKLYVDKPDALPYLGNVDDYRDVQDNPLYEAARLGHKEIAEYLIATFPQLCPQTIIKKALKYPVFDANIEMVELLFGFLEDKNAQFLAEHMFFPYISSESYQNEEDSKQNKRTVCLQFLLDHGASPNSRTMLNSFLTGAIQSHNIAAVRLLLARGVTITTEGPHCDLSAVAMACNIGITELILTSLQPLKPEYLSELVSCAAYRDSIEMVDLLVRYGAHLGNTKLLKSACNHRRSQILSDLLAKYRSHFSDADIKEAIHEAVFNTSPGMLELLYAQLDNPDANEFVNDLFFDAGRGVIDCLQFLLARGLNPDGKTRGDHTLLELAALRNNTRAVEVLLAANANPNVAKDELPLIYAVNHRNFRMVELLLWHDANADVSSREKNEKAIDIARRRRFVDIADLLAKHLPLQADTMMVDETKPDQTNHLYIKCKVGLFAFSIIGVTAGGFCFMKDKPQLLKKLPVRFKANCNFAALKDLFADMSQIHGHNDEAHSLSYDAAEKIEERWYSSVDFGFDSEEKGFKEFRETEFYYDCSDLNEEVVLRAIELITAQYCKKLDAFSKLSEKDSGDDLPKDLDEDFMDDPQFSDSPPDDPTSPLGEGFFMDTAYVITKALMDSLPKPVPQPSALVRNSLLQRPPTASFLCLDSDEEEEVFKMDMT